MKKKSINLLSLILIICTCILGLFSLSSCNNKDITEDENYCEINGWMLLKHTNSDGSARYEIAGITDVLARQKEIVLPDNINGIPVRSVGYHKFEILKEICPNKIFIPDVCYSFNYPYLSVNAGSYVGFPKANKIIFLGYKPNNYLPGFYSWNDNLWKAPYKSATIYVPRDALNDYTRIISDCPDAVFVAANISYLYNYEQSPNSGYYWIDDLDYGNKIITVPPNPVREGYTFNGWFKDAECTEPIDIDNFIMNQSSIEIYANWK